MKQNTQQTTLLTEITQRLTKVGNPEKIVSFGSRSRGTAQVESDYDLLGFAGKVPTLEQVSFLTPLANFGDARATQPSLASCRCCG